MLLPLPGGPIISRLWPPAAATTSARFANAWPRTSARSGAERRRDADRCAARRAASRCAAREVLHDLVQVLRDVDLGVGDERRLGGVGRGQHERVARLLRREHGRQRAVDRPQIAVQRELAEKLRAGDGPGSVLLRQQHAERDREIEAPARLRDVGRSQVHGDAARAEPV